MAGKTTSVSATAFSKEVLKSPQPVLVAFRAAWCVPSQQLIPVIDGLAEQYAGRVRVVSVELNANTEKIARSVGVTRLPVVVLFKDGQAVDSIGGATDEGNIRDMIESHTKPVIDLSEHNFGTEVLKSKVPVLVNFWAAWCKESLELTDIVETLAKSVQGKAKVARLEMRPDTMRLCAEYDVKRVPTTLVFNKGKVEDRILGALKGGTKVGARATSCVNLTSLDNFSQALTRLV